MTADVSLSMSQVFDEVPSSYSFGIEAFDTVMGARVVELSLIRGATFKVWTGGFNLHKNKKEWCLP